MKLINPTKTEESLFEKVNTQVKQDMKAIGKEADPAKRLAQYQSLSESFNSLYGNGQIQKTVDIVVDIITDKEAQKTFNKSTGSKLVSFMGLDLQKTPLRASTAETTEAFKDGDVFAGLGTTILLPLSGPLSYVGFRKAFNIAANHLGLTSKDLRYIINTAQQKVKVEKAITDINAVLEKQKAAREAAEKRLQEITKLHEELDAVAAGKTTVIAPANASLMPKP